MCHASDGRKYTIWVWKGDYINLGAGAEMGIYVGDSGQRIVDTSLALKMRLSLRYKNIRIIWYAPKEKQWWITGFNSHYLNVKAKDLTATYYIAFSDPLMYAGFKAEYDQDPRWYFNDRVKSASFQF